MDAEQLESGKRRETNIEQTSRNHFSASSWV